MRLVVWFERRPSWREGLKLCAVLFLVNLLWTILMMEILSFYAVTVGHLVDPNTRVALQNLSKEPVWNWVGVFLWRAFVEEVGFRFIPLAMAIFIFGRHESMKPAVLIIAIITAVIFGIFHGTGYWYNLVFQGVLGMILAVLYIKCCGMNNQHAATGFCVAWGFHTVWNIFAMANNVTKNYL